jgi:uncharacterized delta-60 repeat protein
VAPEVALSQEVFFTSCARSPRTIRLACPRTVADDFAFPKPDNRRPHRGGPMLRTALQHPTTSVKHRHAILAAALAALLLAHGSARAQSGVLDPTFGNAGVTVTPVGNADDFGRAIVVQDDDRIVVAGTCNTGNDDFCVVRYLLDGTPDPDFGGGTGKVTAAIRTGTDQASAVALDGDGNIVVAGFSRGGSKDEIAVARFLPGGALDAAFDGDGKLTTAVGTLEDHARAVAVDATGRVVVAGYTLTAANRDVALVRYLGNGALDPSFSSDGKVTLSVGTGDDEAAAIAIQSDGKIVLAGYAADGSQHDVLLARFLDNGNLDPAFGGGTGVVRVPFGSGNAFGNAIALQSDGRILVAGYARVGTVFHFAVVRVDELGVLDPQLDGDGRLTTTIGTTSQASAIAVDATGRFVVSGFARFASNDDMALARHDGTGALDTNFGGDGIVTLPVGSGPDAANAVAVQADNKILIAGSARFANNDDIAVARWLIDDCGNGLVDAGEACDGGALIDGDCCSSTCTLLPAATACRPLADTCDVADVCDGASAACPDVRLPDGDGDGVCDLHDLCPVEPDPGQQDGDSDGLGDACDPCTNGVTVLKPKVRITNFVTGPGDDTFSFNGVLDFASAPVLDPVARGARVILEDGDGVRFDVDVPPGAYNPTTRTGWLPNGAGTAFTYRTTSSLGGVIDKLKLSRTASKPDVVKFAMSGKKGSAAANAVVAPLSAIVVLDAPTAATGECGEIAFPGPAPAPSCALNRSGSTLSCK